MAIKKEEHTPIWFYYASIMIAFLFAIYLSVYVSIYFGDLKYMALMVAFLTVTMVSFFLISAVYFQTEKMGYHALSPLLFFAGVVSLIIYAYKAVDATNVVRYSITYTIVVVAISLSILLPKNEKSKQNNKKKKAR